MSQETMIVDAELLTSLQQSLAAGKAQIDETATLIKQLKSDLEKDLDLVQSGQKEVEDTLFDDPFPLLKTISSCLAEPITRADAEIILKDISLISSSKEVIVALEELLTEMRFVEEEFDSDGEDASEEPDLEASLAKTTVYVKAYRECLKRLKTAKPDKFYTTASDTISAVVTHLTVQGAFPDQEQSSDYHLDLDLVESIFQLAMQVSSIEDLTQKQTAQTDARLLIESVVGLLNPLMTCDNAYSFFLTIEPRYQRSNIEKRFSEREISTKRIWTTLLPTLFTNLDYKLDDLLLACRFSNPLIRIGSFSLLSHYLALNPSTALSVFGSDDEASAMPTFLLSATLETIRRSLQPQTAYRLADDAILFFLWWCIQQQNEAGDMEAGLEGSKLYSLVEILSSLSALSSNAQTRFLAFRLLSAIVLDHTGTSRASEVTQLALLKHLLTEENATPSFRTACIGIVKEVLDGKLNQSANAPTFTSIYYTSQFLEELGPSLLRYDPPNLLDDKISAEDFVEKHQRDVSQKLNFYYFLLTRDKENKTLIRSPVFLKATDTEFLSPVRTVLSQWLDRSATTQLNPTISLELELLKTSLDRVDEVLTTLS